MIIFKFAEGLSGGDYPGAASENVAVYRDTFESWVDITKSPSRVYEDQAVILASLHKCGLNRIGDLKVIRY